ncbi:aconitate hydratase [Amorphus suaedae]
MMDSYKTRARFEDAEIVDLVAAEQAFPGMAKLPVSIRILIENLLRSEDGVSVTADDIAAVAARAADWSREIEIAFRPSRVVMQDYAGMPALIDLAALRDKALAAGVDPDLVNPQVPADLVVDHSLMVYVARQKNALAENLKREFSENEERFAFLKWAQQGFDGLRVVPPGQGIIHQINIEYLADVVSRRAVGGAEWLFPDTVIGTDSHTTMVNGLGVLGWGVGGIEAEAVMLGEPVSMLVPPVIGVRLTGAAPAGVLATDIVLTLTETLRKRGVVGTILEFFGPGMASLPVTDRVTIANMSPEFGSTCAFFPSDARTIEYFDLTGRDRAKIERVERYLRRTGLWFDPDAVPDVADVIEFDLSTVRRTVSGPKRPEERRDLSEVPAAASAMMTPRDPAPKGADAGALKDGDIVIAAITSCTNTSNPAAMIAAGLLARKARARGLTVSPRIKTSLAPGSRVVVDYLGRLGVLDDLEALGFGVVGFGCTTCVGNSGDLDDAVTAAIDADDLCVSAVLSGNRNFEGRIHAKVKENFLASPPLVVAYALAGTVLTDVSAEPLGHDPDGAPVHLADLWPSPEEIEQALSTAMDRSQFLSRYEHVLSGDSAWEQLATATGPLFRWTDESTYFRKPPFFEVAPYFAVGAPMITAARPLLILGDSVTTDHISPVGSIAADSPAGRYLGEAGLRPAEFNAYGARRGNHDVMVRGTFANVRLKNEMVDRIGGYTRIMPEGTEATIFDASEAYAARGEDCVVIAGKMYGAGSARDWAAKGTRLLGVKAVIATSFERIHRSNLVRMGVLPLEFADKAFLPAETFAATDTVSLEAPVDTLKPLQRLQLTRTRSDGATDSFEVIARVDTLDELRYLKAGGILPSVAERLLAPEAAEA